jgi:plastocyanin
MRKGYWAVGILLGIVLFTACGNEVPKDEATSAVPAEQQGQAARVVEVTLSFVEPRFRPDPLEIKVGEPVQFKVSSADTRHHFVIDSLGIDVEVPQKSLNESVTTKTVTPTEAGTYRIFCSVHARMPMQGTLVVSQAGTP